MKTLGPYRLKKRLGGGEFGDVWLAHDPKADRQVALKLLKIDKLEAGLLDRFKAEFEILSTLHHAHLADVYHFGYVKGSGSYYFTSEYCAGKNFFDALQSRPLESFEEALVQLLSALDYIHSEGVVHFDIKSQNVLVDDRDGHPVVKLVDFGLAARLKALPEGAAGTLPYMAPEFFVKHSSVNQSADLYALGMLCYGFLMGSWPFETEDKSFIIQWHLKGGLPEVFWSNANIPRYLKEMIAKLLQKKPSERYSNARVVLNFLNLATGRKYRAEEEGFHGTLPSEGPLVEREEILQEIVTKRGVVVVSGEQGIGKSRVLEEVRNLVELQEIPIVDLVELRRSSSAADAGVSYAGQEAGERGLNLAALENTCLFVDDAHQADPETKAFLKKLETVPLSLFVVIASEEPQDYSRVLTLKRLTEEGVRRYARQLLGEQGRLEEIVALLLRYSGGLPLLVVEGLRYLAPFIYQGDSLEGRLPPPGLLPLYEDKIRALSPESRELLTVAALFSRPSTEDELGLVLKISPGDVIKRAAPCFKVGLMKQPYQLSSEALALDLAHSLDPKFKKNLHEKIAKALEKIKHASQEETALHWEEAGRKEEARKAYSLAAEAFRKEGQIAPAARCLNRALLLCEEGSPIWKDLSYEGARLLILSGAYSQAEKILLPFKESPSFRSRSLQGWLAFKERRFEEAREDYQAALDLIPEGLKLGRVMILNSLGNVALQSGEIDRAVGFFEKGLALEKNLARGEAARVTNNNLGLALSLQGKYDEAIAFFQERLKKFDPKKILERAGLFGSLGYVALQASHYTAAIDYLRQALELAEKSGVRHLLFSAMGNLTTALLKEGHYAECLDLLKKMIRHQQRLGTTRDLAFNWLRQASVYLLLGMEEATREALAKGKSLSVEAGDETLFAWFVLMEGYWEKEFGDLKKAADFFQKCERLTRQTNNPDLLSWSLYAQADLALDRKDPEEAAKYLSAITMDPQDEEFRVRLDLLAVRLEILKGRAEKSCLEKATRLEEKCRQSHFQEILWEVYETQGLCERALGNASGAAAFFKKGIAVIESIASGLPEEYRDRYRSHRPRLRLYKEDLP